MQPEDWDEIAHLILQLAVPDNCYQYSGVVVTHGTDTLAYTASALAFLLRKQLKIPVILIASQVQIEPLPLHFLIADVASNNGCTAQRWLDRLC